MRILILTSRDIYSESGEAALMRSKEDAFRKLDCQIAYIGCRWRRPVTGDSRIIRTFATWQWLLNSLGQYRELMSDVRAWKPDVLVVSGHWLKLHPWIIGRVQRMTGIVVSLDLQGALEEFTEYALVKDSPALSWIVMQLLSWSERSLVKRIQVMEVVSNNFRDYVARKYPWFRGETVVVPCGISKIFDDENYADQRTRWRKKLGIGEDEIVAVYSGGLSKWQRVDDVIAFARANPAMRVFLMLNEEPGDLSKNATANVVVMSLPRHEAAEALCAFDYGFLLRYSDVTNRVAFPNKASEYLNARLRIVIDSAELGCMQPEFSSAFVRLPDVDVQKPVSHRSDYSISGLQYDLTVKQLRLAYERAVGRAVQ